MLTAIFLASQWHFLANKHAVLAGCSAFWPVNCIFLHKKTRTCCTAEWPFCYCSLLCVYHANCQNHVDISQLTSSHIQRPCVLCSRNRIPSLEISYRNRVYLISMTSSMTKTESRRLFFCILDHARLLFFNDSSLYLCFKDIMTSLFLVFMT
jgi:hypothetical protein